MVPCPFWIQKHHPNNGHLHGLENSTCQSTCSERFPTYWYMRIWYCFHYYNRHFLQFYFRICNFHLYRQISVYSYLNYSLIGTFAFA
nr:unnamed protein product [Callosobruchus analis]